MSYLLTKGKYVVNCNGCSETVAGEDNERLQAVIDRTTAFGWVTFEINGRWEHRCPSCAEDF